jgi:hypothetical protein
MPNPFVSLIHSRKFLIMIVDVALSTLVFFLAKYANESMVEDVKFLIASWQPVILMVIAAIASEDNATAKAQSTVDAAKAMTANK